MERTEETLKARVRETPLTDRLSECQKRIGKMCAERRAPRMCIPVQHDDDDFFICTTLADAQATVEALRRERDELKELTSVICGHCCEPMAIPSRAVLQAALDAEREKVKGLAQQVQDQSTANLETMRHTDDMQSRALDAERALARLQALVRAFFTSEDKWVVAYRELERLGYTLDATTPALTMKEARHIALDILDKAEQERIQASKGGDGE